MFGFKAKNGETNERKNWYADRYQYVVVQRNILAVITVVAILAALAAAFSISQLAPLKSVEPFVIQVDQRSGITQVVNPLTSKDLNGNDALNNYFMVQYIRAHESYGVADAPNYNVIRVMSDPDIFRAYATAISVNNPESPRNTLRDGLRRVDIGNMTLIDNRPDADGVPRLRYQIHILEEDDKRSGEKVSAAHKLVTMAFKYAELELSSEDRYLNPLGFRVVEYRVDDDTLNR